MLKIKDDVDLKELENFGLKYKEDKTSSYYGCCLQEAQDNDGIFIFINNARIISITISKEHSIFKLNTLYDLIQAGLVEKVDDKK